MADNPENGIKQNIQAALHSIGRGDSTSGIRELLAVLGYSSERRIADDLSTAKQFRDQFGELNDERALTEDWTKFEFLFQLTDEEIGNRLAFSKGAVDTTIIESYLFIAVCLKGTQYTRTRLANAAREINRLFPMPVMVVFRYANVISIAVIDRELNKRDSSKDVLRKVTLIKDIRLEEPARAHLDILSELSLEALHEQYAFRNFVELHRAWAQKLDSSDLNKRFYQDISYWYLWAKNHPNVVLPKDVNAKSDEQRSIFFIRLLTRIIFCWFLQEKGLIPRQLFRWAQIRELLKDSDHSAGTYYQAILQNLFFGTLNREPGKRGFREKKTTGRYDANRGVTALYRYQDFLRDKDALLTLFKEVPFVNGGLFDCLDEVRRKGESEKTVRLDGFSDNYRESVTLPNELFFGQDKRADLSKELDDHRKDSVSVRPLLEILTRYKFTVEENTPLEQEIALDPELLGKVFENLLASYNDDTKTIARKKLGAFYTPRDVVRYMVDEALVLHLSSVVTEAKLRQLLSDKSENPCTSKETEKLIEAIEKTKVLDPACGSGAFPMGALQRLVLLLSKLDPNNIGWKKRQLEAAQRDLQKAESMEDAEDRESSIANVNARIEDINLSFDTAHHDLDYARKLYLIENSIYGVDIQPIACQIAKLRFFIALLVDQKSERTIQPLPNLETRLVAANTLIPIEKIERHQYSIGADQVKTLRERLRRIRHDHFNAKTPESKQRFREKDAETRTLLSEELEGIGMPNTTARLLAGWDPYDQNSHAEFFDPEWMFSLDADQFPGFNIVIGNPPYVRQEKIKDLKPALKDLYACYSGTADLYVYFYERGIQLLRDGGIFSFITSNKWMVTGYGAKLREFLNKNTKVRRLADFDDAEIFDAIAYPCIILLEKGAPEMERPFAALSWHDGWGVADVIHHLAKDTFPMSQGNLKLAGWLLGSEQKLSLVDRIRSAGPILEKYVKGRCYRGILTGLNEAFVVSRETRDELIRAHRSSSEVLSPYLRGRDVKRWQLDFEEQYLIRIESSENVKHPWTGLSQQEAENSFAKTYPAIHAFMEPLRKKLVERYDQGKYYWELRACAYWGEFSRPKLIVPAIAETVNFATDYEGYYCNNKATIFVPDLVAFTCAIANSQVSAWYAAQTFATKQGGFLDFEPRYSGQIVVPHASDKHRAILNKVAEGVISTQGEPGIAAFLERLSNALVYELFFSEELYAQKLRFFDILAEISIPASNDMAEWKSFYRMISDVNHPLYAALFSLDAVEIIRIIEDRE